MKLNSRIQEIFFVRISSRGEYSAGVLNEP
jgi:hypothetical protein